jgi:hypothetical protein
MRRRISEELSGADVRTNDKTEGVFEPFYGGFAI